jgi:hypothetical protein
LTKRWAKPDGRARRSNGVASGSFHCYGRWWP